MAKGRNGGDEKTQDEVLDERSLKIARETLTGDVRDMILMDMKDRKTSLPWNLRGEEAQKETIEQVTRFAEGLVERIVRVVAAGGRKVIQARLNKVTIKDEIKAELELSKMDEQRHQLMDSTGAAVMVVIADAEIFQGQRAPVVAAKDQKPMFDPDTGEIAA